MKAANPWLVYGDRLHRLREFGAAFKEMDLIDETALGSGLGHDLFEDFVE